MKDKKFAILCVLGSIWALIFVSMLFGAKIPPRVEQMVTVICIVWFAYWTISFLRKKPDAELDNIISEKVTKTKKKFKSK